MIGQGIPLTTHFGWCCCCCCREIDLQHSVLSAQLSAQSAAIKQEREALLNQRINTDMLASLSEQVGHEHGTLYLHPCTRLAIVPVGAAPHVDTGTCQHLVTESGSSS
jgi:hypothetical protein